MVRKYLIFSCTEAVLHKRCPASVCLFSAAVLIGFLWKFRLTSRGPLSLVVAWHPVPTCLSVRLIKSRCVSWGCYSSCLDLLLIDSCFASRRVAWSQGIHPEDLHTHVFHGAKEIYSYKTANSWSKNIVLQLLLCSDNIFVLCGLQFGFSWFQNFISKNLSKLILFCLILVQWTLPCKAHTYTL